MRSKETRRHQLNLSVPLICSPIRRIWDFEETLPHNWEALLGSFLPGFFAANCNHRNIVIAALQGHFVETLFIRIPHQFQVVFFRKSTDGLVNVFQLFPPPCAKGPQIGSRGANSIINFNILPAISEKTVVVIVVPI